MLIPTLIGSSQWFACNSFRYDSVGDHLQTCQFKSSVSQTHDWVVYRLGDILGSVGHRVKIHKITPATGKESEIVLSTRYGKTRVFINKTFSTETAYQQDLIRLIVGKVGPDVWCGKFNSTSNVLVCETQRKMNMFGCVSE